MSDWKVVQRKRPPWWRPRARRRADRQAAMLQKVINNLPTDPTERVERMMLDLMLYGQAYIEHPASRETE